MPQWNNVPQIGYSSRRNAAEQGVDFEPKIAACNYVYKTVRMGSGQVGVVIEHQLPRDYIYRRLYVTIESTGTGTALLSVDFLLAGQLVLSLPAEYQGSGGTGYRYGVGGSNTTNVPQPEVVYYKTSTTKYSVTPYSMVLSTDTVRLVSIQKGSDVVDTFLAVYSATQR